MTAGGSSTFVMIGGSPRGSSVMGVWDAAQEQQEAGISFDLGTGSAPQPVVFLCELPSDLEQAAGEIGRAEANLQASQAVLEEAQIRLETLVQSQAGGVSFDTSSSAPAPGSPESEVLALMGFSEVGGELDFVSFAAGEEKSNQWEKVTDQFQEFLQQLDQIVGHFAWVETQVNGSLVVRSSVGWTGNLETAWNTLPNPDLAALHQRTLKLALASRAAMLRTFGVVTGGAVKLAALAATPAGAILALPAAWKFIRQVQAESTRYASIKEEIEHG